MNISFRDNEIHSALSGAHVKVADVDFGIAVGSISQLVERAFRIALFHGTRILVDLWSRAAHWRLGRARLGISERNQEKANFLGARA